MSDSDIYQYSVERTAILLVDPFNDFLSEGGKLWPLVKETAKGPNLVNNLKHLIVTARNKGVKVIYVPHRRTERGIYDGWKFKNFTHAGLIDGNVFAKGEWGGEFHPELAPEEGDLIAQDHWTASGFANTDLDFLLKQNGIDHVVLSGLRANTCIESTARYAVELGYHATLLSDAIAAFSQDEMKATIETNFPAFGHSVLSVEDFLESIS